MKNVDFGKKEENLKTKTGTPFATELCIVTKLKMVQYTIQQVYFVLGYFIFFN